ncbi:glycine cleavage system protein H [Streptomyces sp. 1222.5]|uniref:glycine cleavage system protein H n=1 Tax=Streptomyces sp. 1222.5 TaxID=1881026 RepID=UPI003EBBD0DF
MSDVPSGLLYTRNHDWFCIDSDGLLLVGVTDYAQRALGDVVFAELCAANVRISEGDVVATLESTKAVSEVYAPTSGEVIAVNESIVRFPERINSAPYASWLMKMRPATEIRGMSSEEYARFIA